MKNLIKYLLMPTLVLVLSACQQYSNATGKPAGDTKTYGEFDNRSDYPTPTGWKHPLSFARTPKRIEYPEAKMANVKGAKLFFLKDDELPLIDLSIKIKMGEIDVPLSQKGLPELLSASLIRGGTKKYSPRELALALDDDAIKLSFRLGEESSSISLSLMKEDWKKGLELLEEVMARPRFDEKVVAISKSRLMQSYKRSGGSARNVVYRESDIWHFKGHPYGRDPLKAIETLPAIKSDDLKLFLKKLLVPANMTIAISGDISKKEAIEGLEKVLEALPKSKANDRVTRIPKMNGPVLALINKPGQVQSVVRMELPGMKRSNPDYWKLSFMLSVFGGRDSRLYKRLRDDLGYVYYAYGYQSARWEAGVVLIYFGAQGNNTGRAILESIKVAKGMTKELPKKEFHHWKMDLLNRFVFNVDTPSALVNTYAGYALKGEPLNTLSRIQDAYINIKREDIPVLAKKYLDTSKLQIFVVGDKNFKVLKKDEKTNWTLGEELKAIALELKLPFKEIKLR